MSTSAFLALLNNAAILLAAVVAFDIATSRRRFGRKLWRQVVVGIFLGFLGIGLIADAYRLETGIVFDTRSVLLAVSGLFIGSVPTAVAMLMAAAYRLSQGGAAMWAGTAVILVTGTLGVVWRRSRRGSVADISVGELYLFGVVVHVLMLALMLTLPWETGVRTLKGIALPVLLIYPVATVALGLLLANRLRRENIEAKLAESEEQFRSMFEMASIGMAQTDVCTRRWLSVNHSLCKITGYSPDELLAMTVPEIMCPEDQARDREAFQRMVCGETPNYRMEKRYLRKDGSIVWVNVNMTVINDADGQPVRTMATIEDITQRKRTQEQADRVFMEAETSRQALLSMVEDLQRSEEALKKSEEKYALAFNLSPYVITLSRIDNGNLIEVNTAFEKMSGYTRAEACGHSADDLSVWVNAGDRQQVLDALSRGREIVGQEYPFRMKNGEIKFGFYSARSILLDGVPCILASINDITARKRAEEEVLQNQARFRSLASLLQFQGATTQEFLDFALSEALALTGSKIGYIFLYNEDRRQLVLNTWSRDVMRECSVANSPTCYELDTTGIWGEAVRQRRPVLLNDFTVAHPLKRGTPAGHVKLSNYLTLPVFSDDRIVAAVGVANKTGDYNDADIQQLRLLMEAAWKVVERRNALEALNTLNAELEQRVAARTEQLESANRELEAFSYSVSHDLRAPLRAVDGFTRILTEDYATHLDAEGKRICSVISQSAKDMGRLIDDLLAFSRIGRRDMQGVPVDLTALVRSVYSDLTTPEDRERIDFRVGDLPPVAGDPALLRQVWVNLLSNAVKFSSKKERAVIEVSAEQRGGETVYVVRDDGAGFDMQYADKLFGVFQRLHSAKEFDGTGVGLAIVQRIISRHGGRIWAEGRVGQGATFSFTLNK